MKLNFKLNILLKYRILLKSQNAYNIQVNYIAYGRENHSLLFNVARNF